MKIWIICFLNMFFLIAFSADVILGIALPFSGAASEIGRDQLNALKLANKSFTGYGNYNIKLDVVDIAANVKEATVNLINDNSIAIIGYPWSSQAIRAVNLSGNFKIPMILTTATNSILLLGKEYVSMTMPSDSEEARAMSEFIIKKFKNPKIAFVYEKNQIYCSGLASKIHTYLDSHLFRFDQKNFAFDKKITKSRVASLGKMIKNYDPDLIIFFSYPDISVQLIRFLLKSKLHSVYLFSSSFEDDVFRDAFPSLGDDFYFCTIEIDKKQDLYKKVSNQYREAYSQELDIYSLMAYNSYLIFYNAFKNCIKEGKELTRDNINFFIRNTKNLKILGGKINFVVETGGGGGI